MRRMEREPDINRLVFGALAARPPPPSPRPPWPRGPSRRRLHTRERLREIADQYRASQADGRAIMHLKPMGEWVNYYENYDLSSMTFGGVISTPQKVDWDRSFYDTASCSVYVESIVTNPAHPYVLATIVRASGAIGSPIGTIAGIDVIVTDKDDWLFDASKTLYYAQREDWTEIPEARRNTREQLQAAADAYLNLFKDKTVSAVGHPVRAPGRQRLHRQGPTDRQLQRRRARQYRHGRTPLRDRPVFGAVAVFLKMGPNKRADAHVFRIEDGKIRYIHTITNCGTQVNCGFDPLPTMIQKRPDFYANLDRVAVVTRPQR